MSQLRVAVIGGGHLGKIHARLISSIKCVHLVAIADPCAVARKNVIDAVECDIKQVADYRELISEIDAAIIATPTRFHYEIAAELIRGGVHLLIEKPMTDSVADAEAIVKLAAQYKCVVAVGHCEQFNAAIRTAFKEIGTPKFIQASRMSGYTFRSTDIGVVHDLMIHDLDLVNSMFSGHAVETRATGVSIFGNHEDIAQARIQFSCGGVANLTASRCSFTPERSFQIFGTDGFAKVDLAKQQVDFVRIPSWIRQREYDFESATAEGREFVKEQLFTEVLPRQQTEVEPVNAILCEQQDWLNAISLGALPRVSAEQGRQAVELAQSVLDSIQTHCWSEHDACLSGPLATPTSNALGTDAIPRILELSQQKVA